MADSHGLLYASERSRRIAVGLIAFLFLAAVTTLGIKIRVGGNPLDYYQVEASFTEAGQGLQAGSDVKVRSLDIGRVRSVRLEDGKARVRMDIRENRDVPRTATATVRPKTLFGEKYIDIDPGPDETNPASYLKDEEVLAKTIGGFELEQVLVDLYPILRAIDPIELTTVLSELAKGADGTAQQTNRLLGTYSQVLRTQAEIAPQTDQLLRELARLAEAFERLAPKIDALAEDLNTALPDLNAKSAELSATLDQLARFSADLNDLLQDNRPFFDKAIKQGGKTLALLFERRTQIGPLITGLRQFFQVLGSVGRIPYGDGTNLAAVKYVANSACPRGRVDGCGTSVSPSGATRGRAPGKEGGTQISPEDLRDAGVPKPSQNLEAVLDLVGGVLR